MKVCQSKRLIKSSKINSSVEKHETNLKKSVFFLIILWANTLEIQTLTGLSITKATEPKLNNFRRRSLIQLFSPWKHIQFLLARPQALLSFIIHSCLYILSFFGFLNFTLPKQTFFPLRPEPRHFWDIFFL